MLTVVPIYRLVDEDNCLVFNVGDTVEFIRYNERLSGQGGIMRNVEIVSVNKYFIEVKDEYFVRTLIHIDDILEMR